MVKVHAGAAAYHHHQETTMTTKKGHALRDFTDAGTGKSFEADKAHDFTAGEYENYLAAGLIREPGHAAADTSKVKAST